MAEQSNGPVTGEDRLTPTPLTLARIDSASPAVAFQAPPRVLTSAASGIHPAAMVPLYLLAGSFLI